MNKKMSKENSLLITIFIGIIFYIYGFIGRIQLFEYSYFNDIALNQWDTIFEFMTNIYLQNYFITPIILFLSIKVIQENDGAYQIIRSGTIRKWVFGTSKQFLQKVGVILLLQLIVSLLLTIGTPIEIGWSSFAEQTELTDIASANFSNINNAPIVALFIQVFVFVLGYLTLHLIITSFYLIKKNRNWILIFSILLWLYTIVSLVLFQGSFPRITIMNFLNWFVGSQAFTTPYHSIALGFFYFVLCIGMTMLWDYNFYASKEKTFDSDSVLPKKVYLIYYFLMILIILYSLIQGRATSINEVIIISGLGSSNGTFHFMFYLAYLIIFYGIVYLNLLYVDELVRKTSYYQLIRTQSINRYSLYIFAKLSQHIMVFLFIFLGIIVVISKLFFFLPAIAGTDNFKIYEVLYHFFVNHFLQIIVYLLFSIIFYFILEELFLSFVLLVTLSFLMFPPFNGLLFIPIGLNSFSYLFDGHSPYIITSILLLYTAIELVVVYYFLNYRDLNL